MCVLPASTRSASHRRGGVTKLFKAGREGITSMLHGVEAFSRRRHPETLVRPPSFNIYTPDVLSSTEATGSFTSRLRTAIYCAWKTVCVPACRLVSCFWHSRTALPCSSCNVIVEFLLCHRHVSLCKSQDCQSSMLSALERLMVGLSVLHSQIAQKMQLVMLQCLVGRPRCGLFRYEEAAMHQ